MSGRVTGLVLATVLALVVSTAASATTSIAVSSSTAPPVVDPAGVFTDFDDATVAALRDALQQGIADKPLGQEAALAVGVYHRGQVWKTALGPLGPKHKGTASTSTSFRLASITKTFTAIAVLQQVEAGRLSLDTPIANWLPSWPRGDEITVRHLLSHTSGIKHYPRRGPDRRLNKHLTMDQTLAVFQDRALAFSPGQRFLYTSYGYGVLGKLLEVVTGEPFDDVLHDAVIDPLGLPSVFLEDSRHPQPDWPAGLKAGTSGKLVRSDVIDLSSRAPGGGARGSVDDLLVYAQALLRQDLVSASSWQAMTTATTTGIGRQADYGLGFAVYPKRGQWIVAHAGGQPGTSSLLHLVPEADLAVVLLTNLEGQGTVLGQLADDFTEVLLEGGEVRRNIYADDVVDDLVADTLNRAFSHGLAQPQLATRAGPAGVDAAFASLWRALDVPRLEKDPSAARVSLRELHHPKNGAITPRVGAAVASALLQDTVVDTVDTVVVDVAQRKADLSRAGPLAFFAAYLDRCDARPERCPGPRRPPPAIAARIRRLHQTLEAERQLTSLRGFFTARAVDLRDVEQVTRWAELLAPGQTSARPDAEAGLLEAVNSHLRRRRTTEALALARIAHRLYPRRPMPQLLVGELLLLQGDEAGGKKALQSAFSSPSAKKAISKAVLSRHQARLARLGGADVAAVFQRVTSNAEGEAEPDDDPEAGDQ